MKRPILILLILVLAFTSCLEKGSNQNKDDDSAFMSQSAKREREKNEQLKRIADALEKQAKEMEKANNINKK